jgi:hypothetical protein
MVLDLGQEQLGVLRRALDARVRDMHTRLGGDATLNCVNRAGS